MAVEDKYADEIMSDDKLDDVSGGSCHELADDSRFLNSLNGSTDRYGATKMLFSGGTNRVQEVKDAWSKLGVTTDVTNLGWNNKYYINGGQQITQEEARQHAMKVTGHYMTESDWKW